ncbi:MAG: hypothetical protein KJ970_14075 [Candidatus Eisenbacteria bacterium]|uniref:NADH:flavin oxidoreductase/NADH oxidase N-terminal domain-containing protein n=1 Tax=Eiseniibacteriota bacterium TaxID=2212470 RepID=A0A948RVZ7_UNCEI|nr:hypothetical protein [Candidatus Eisenbacteria bacterium]MBU1947713.1 hypothetical protein [Candidatus Eisenbacteria bacterium]MBU2692043.1 hypothetical protein [Candidatus Eisenbacteria bacterium]
MSSSFESFRYPSKAALLKKCDGLGLSISYLDNFDLLFTPLAVGDRQTPNRFAIQPMEGCDGTEDGAPTPLTFRRYQRFAAGGAGLIWFEATAVTPEGRANPHHLLLSKANLPDFKRLVEETRHAAAVAVNGSHAILLILQLTHAGRYARPVDRPQPVRAQYNPILDPLQGLTEEDPLITDEGLLDLQDQFLNAAELALAAGFDGVDVKACHGYLISELLAAATRLESRFGGLFDNRSRFLTETVQKIHEEFPGLIAASRINVYDGVEYPYGFGVDSEDPDQFDLWEPIELIKKLKNSGCALLNITMGIPYVNPHIGRPYNTPLAGGKSPAEHPLIGIDRLMTATRVLQQGETDLPMVGTGYSWLQHHWPHVGAGVVQSGGAQLIGIGRGAIAYPDFVKDLYEKGAMDPGSVCIGCSRCSQLMRDHGRAGCVVRDAEIYQLEYQQGRDRAKESEG